MHQKIKIEPEISALLISIVSNSNMLKKEVLLVYKLLSLYFINIQNTAYR